MWSSWPCVSTTQSKVVWPLDNRREVGQDKVDAEHVLVGEHEAAIDQGKLAVDLEDGTVAPDLAEATEEADRDGHELPRS